MKTQTQSSFTISDEDLKQMPIYKQALRLSKIEFKSQDIIHEIQYAKSLIQKQEPIFTQHALKVLEQIINQIKQIEKIAKEN